MTRACCCLTSRSPAWATRNREKIYHLLKDLARDHAVLLIEHDMDFVFAVADRMTVMVEGSLLASGPPDTIRANPAVQRAYLGATP